MSMKYTVKQLIEKLKEQDENNPVILEGCDCVGDWNGEVAVDVEWAGKGVLLKRD